MDKGESTKSQIPNSKPFYHLQGKTPEPVSVIGYSGLRLENTWDFSI
jgi:hypothetical protein